MNVSCLTSTGNFQTLKKMPQVLATAAESHIPNVVQQLENLTILLLFSFLSDNSSSLQQH